MGSRVTYFVRPNRMIVLLAGFLKRTQQTPPAEIERAKDFRADYLERCTDGEDDVDEGY